MKSFTQEVNIITLASEPDENAVSIVVYEKENIKSNKYLPEGFDGLDVPSVAYGVPTKVLVPVTSNVSKKIIETVVSSLKLLPKSATKVNVILPDTLSVDVKHLVSDILMETIEPFNFKTKEKTHTPLEFSLIYSGATVELLQHGIALAKVRAFISNLIFAPSNVITPIRFIDEVHAFIRQNGLGEKIKFNHIDEKTLEEMKMGALLAVGKASVNPPQMLELEYAPKSTTEIDVCFVGKGITFDTGGLSLKPGASMPAMKADMAGAANTVGALLYAALVDLDVNLVSVSVLAENAVAGNAMKPSDVITTFSGKTVEVDNTDAEGRLVLADGLFYSQKFKAKQTIDVATLTGACVMALSTFHSGLFSQDKDLVEKLYALGENNGDKVWHMPLDEEHQEMIKSKIADFNNISTMRGGGAIVGAAFLKNFAPEKGWAHLDVAGTAHVGGTPTGRPLRLLSDYLDSI